MRERQNRRTEEDDGSGQTEEEEESPGAAPSEVQVELKGVLLEELRTEEDVQEEGMLYVLTGGLSQTGDDAVLLQFQDSAQQQGEQSV